VNPWQVTGIARLAELAAAHQAPAIGLVDGSVDTAHPAFGGIRVRAAACTNRQGPGCRHGTFVAGQLARVSPSSEIIGHSLFCEADSLDACPVVGPRDLAAAIEQLVDQGARIINMSVGLRGPVTGSMATLARAYRRARARGVLLVAAAGNDARSDVNPLFRDEWVIPVAAHDQAGSILPTSNRGGAVASHGLIAPGEDLPGPAAGGGHTTMSGTSVAAPLVAAGAALLWALHPQASAEQLRLALLRPQSDRRAPIPPSLDLVESHAWLSRALQPTRPAVRPTMTQSHSLEPVSSRSSTLGSPLVSPGRSPAATKAPWQGVVPQACGCGPGPGLGFVYSAGQLAVRFPDEGDRKEYEARASELGVNPDDQYTVLSKSRYLARRVCWVLEVFSEPAGILVPQAELVLTDLVEALRSELRPNPIMVVTGTLGRTAPASKCDGLQVPLVSLAELSYFTQDKLLDQIAKEAGLDPRDLGSAADRIWQLTGVLREPGFDDEQRAKNFVVLRTTALYEKTIELSKGPRPFWLQSITAAAKQTEAGRSVVDVDATFQSSTGQTQTWRVQIDVTDLFAFTTKPLFPV